MVGTRRTRAGGSAVSPAASPTKAAKGKQVKPSAARSKDFSAQPAQPVKSTRRTRATARAEGVEYSPLRAGLERTPPRKQVTKAKGKRKATAPAAPATPVQNQSESEEHATETHRATNGYVTTGEGFSNSVASSHRETPISFIPARAPSRPQTIGAFLALCNPRPSVSPAPAVSSPVIAFGSSSPVKVFSSSVDAFRSSAQGHQALVQSLKEQVASLQDELSQSKEALRHKDLAYDELAQEMNRVHAINDELTRRLHILAPTQSWLQSLPPVISADPEEEVRQTRPAFSPVTSPGTVEANCPPEARDMLAAADNMRAKYLASQSSRSSRVLGTPESSTVGYPSEHMTPVEFRAGATPKTPKTQERTGLWGTLSSVFKRTFSKATTPIASPIAEPVIGEFTEALAPTPTKSARASRLHQRPRDTVRLDKLVESVKMSAVTGDDEQDLVEQQKIEAWVHQLVDECRSKTVATGGKRKRVDDDLLASFVKAMETGVPYEDLNHFSAKPWKSAVGTDDELADRIDDTPEEMAPAWAVLLHLRNEIEDQFKAKQESEDGGPPSKRQKSGDSPVFNSHGQSTSLSDLEPRSCLAGLAQSQNKGHDNNPFNADTTNTDTDGPAWTQQPPSTPVIRHATLPTPVAQTPSVPAASGNLLDRPAVDSVRAHAMKHTPAQPSRLRHQIQPSPSVQSDAGDDSPSKVPSSFQSAAAAAKATPATPAAPATQIASSSALAAAPRQSATPKVTRNLFAAEQSNQGPAATAATAKPTNAPIATSNQTATAGNSGVSFSAMLTAAANKTQNDMSSIKSASTDNVGGIKTTFAIEVPTTERMDRLNKFKATIALAMPKAKPLDLPADQLERLNKRMETQEHKDKIAAMTASWPAPIVEWDESDESSDEREQHSSLGLVQ